MKPTIYTIFFSLLFGNFLLAQSDLKALPAKLIRSYGVYQEDPELHYCCQGFPVDSLLASSTLKSQSGNDYSIHHLGDNKAETAWIEGTKDNGVGEFIQFDYTYNITYSQAAEGAFNYKDEWQILNGYQKNLQTWKDNGRIKRLKMYINEVAFCYIDLLDKPGVQSVPLGFLDYLEKDKETIRIKLEIMEVYAGDKYTDTALSEILW